MERLVQLIEKALTLNTTHAADVRQAYMILSTNMSEEVEPACIHLLDAMTHLRQERDALNDAHRLLLREEMAA